MMAQNGGVDFLTGFLNSFAEAKNKKKEQDLGETQRKLQTKLFENQLEAMQLKSAAEKELGFMQRGIGQAGPEKPKSLLDILADPRGQQLLVQSGDMSTKDIISAQRRQSAFGPGNVPPGMILSGVKITDDGDPMYDYTLPQADKQVPDATGRNIVTLDKQGKPISSRPAAPEEISLTPAQKAIDTKFAEEYTDFKTAGGYADVQKGVNQLKDALKALNSSDDLTGPVIGGVSDSVLKFTNPKAIATREKVEEVVQKNLRLVLGAQFTEKEGERLIARSYNPNLSETENAQRLSRLITQIQGAAQAKMGAIKYYEENGTLAGFKGKIPSIGDFNPESGAVSLSPDDEALVNKYLK